MSLRMARERRHILRMRPSEVSLEDATSMAHDLDVLEWELSVLEGAYNELQQKWLNACKACDEARAQVRALEQPDIEALASAVHAAYLRTCDRLGWLVRPENRVPYTDLSEESKELDRATVRAVLANIPISETVSAPRYPWHHWESDHRPADEEEGDDARS